MPWCEPCNRWFVTDLALNQHQYYSPAHRSSCANCGHDCWDWEEMATHVQAAGHGHVCRGCPTGDTIFWTDDAYEEHVHAENVCTVCGRHFADANEAFQHRVVHLEKKIQCVGCVQYFVTVSAMMLHLDGNHCAHLSSKEMHRMAAQFPYSSTYLNDNAHAYIESGWTGQQVRLFKGIYAFECSECDSVYSSLSALFQHAETKSCNQTVIHGSLKALVSWMENDYSPV